MTADATLAAVIPEEPPTYSVVIDRHQWAWQRLGGRWTRNATPLLLIGPPESKTSSTSWANLLVNHGPVSVVYTPPAEEG